MTDNTRFGSWQELRDICHRAKYDILASEPGDYFALVVSYPGVKVRSRGGKDYDIDRATDVCDALVRYVKKHDELPPKDKLATVIKVGEPATAASPASKKPKAVKSTTRNAGISVDKVPTPTQETTVAVDGDKGTSKPVVVVEPATTTTEKQPTVEPTDTHTEGSQTGIAIKVDINPNEIPFANYPIELKEVPGWMFDCGKVPADDEKILATLPSKATLESNAGKVYFVRGWMGGSSCRSIEAATIKLNSVCNEYKRKYPQEPEMYQVGRLFGLGILTNKYPNLLFFECDNAWLRLDKDGNQVEKGGDIVRSEDGTQYFVNTHFGQSDFFQYCLDKHYHVAKSRNGNMHYVMELPDCCKNLPPYLMSDTGSGFKLLDKGDDNKDEGDFEISNNHNSQWFETGYTYSTGTIIPADDEVAVAFVKARIERAIKRHQAKQAGGKTTAKSVPGGTTAASQLPGTRATVDNHEVDMDIVNRINHIEKGKLGNLLHKIDTERKVGTYDLSTHLQSFANLLRLHGVPNYETFLALFHHSALERAYQARGDYNQKVHDEKLKRTWDKAVRDVSEKFFRVYKNNDGETRKEVLRAINHYNRYSGNAIFYSKVNNCLVVIQEDGNLIEMSVEDLKCELTSKEFIWLDDFDNETQPSMTPIKSAIMSAGVPQLCCCTSGGWVTSEGEIVCTKGYHDGVYLRKDIDVEPIPEDITHEHLRQARSILVRPFKDVKYKYPEGLDDTLYSLFAMFLHPSIEHALFAIIFNKNKAGIGGSFAAKLLLMLRHNEPIREPTALGDVEALVREIISSDLSKHETGYANFDNLMSTRALGVVGLMLHSGNGVYNDRLKYGRHTSAIDTRKDIVYNGRDVMITSDFCRRTLEIPLFWQGGTNEISFAATQEEEARKAKDTLDYAATHHSETLWAIAVAIKAWVQDGKRYPKTKPTANWAEFSDYHSVVGGALEMLGFNHFLQHIHETQVDNNSSINLVKERIEVLHEAFLSKSGQTTFDESTELYEGRPFTSADLFNAMYPTKEDIALLMVEMEAIKNASSNVSVEKKAQAARNLPAAYYSTELKRLFGGIKGVNLTNTLKDLVAKGTATNSKYMLIEDDTTTGGYKHFRVATVYSQVHKNRTNQQTDSEQ